MSVFKKLNKKEKVFYVFEINTTTFSIFDSNIDVPIYNGSWNFCANIIKSIKFNITDAKIYYYSKSKNNQLKLELQWSWHI